VGHKRAMIRRFTSLAALILAAAVAGCQSNSAIRITNDKPVAAVAKPRSEPVFYNGKTYHLDFSPAAGGTFDMRVAGMGPKQKKDAIAVATSSLGYFACPDGQRGRLLGEPAYADATWRMQAKCG